MTALTKKDFATDQMVRWCPGCGDFTVLSAITKALAMLQLPPHEVAVVSGIGCSSRIPAYTTCYGFHGVHVRALAAATGLKVARPELTVLVTGGDDDVFLHRRPEVGIERRNVDGVRHDESSLPRMPLEGFDTQLRIDDSHHGSTIRLRARELKSRWTRMTWTAARLHSMESIVLLCTDGSDVSIKALRSSLPILAPPDRIIVVTVESPTDPELTTAIESAARRLQAPHMSLPSGAGHDALVLARHIPSAMLFVPSIGGRSHHISEDTSEEDIILGANVLLGVAEERVSAKS